MLSRTPIICIIPFFTGGNIAPFRAIPAFVPFLLSPEHTMCVFQHGVPVAGGKLHPLAGIHLILPYADRIAEGCFRLRMIRAEQLSDPDIRGLLDIQDQVPISMRYQRLKKTQYLSLFCGIPLAEAGYVVSDQRMKFYAHLACSSFHRSNAPFSAYHIDNPARCLMTASDKNY